MVRYEDLKADPVSELTGVLEFLNLDVDRTRLEKAIESCSSESLRKLEKRDRDAGKVVLRNESTQVDGKYFFFTGRVRGSLKQISDEMDELFNASFQETLEALGNVWIYDMWKSLKIQTETFY